MIPARLSEFTARRLLTCPTAAVLMLWTHCNPVAAQIITPQRNVDATYLGHIFGERVQGISIMDNAEHDIILCGETNSDFMADNPTGVQSLFAAAAAANTPFDHLWNSANNNEAWIAIVSADLSTLKYWTYLGGSGDDRAYFATEGSLNTIWVCGFTESTSCALGSTSFPNTNTSGCYGARGAEDVFVVQLNSTLQTLHYSTVIGGSGLDTPRGSMYVKKATGSPWKDTVYLSGATADHSTNDFPLVNTPSGGQSGHNGNQDAFVVAVKPSANGNGLLDISWSILLGGAGTDQAWAGVRLNPATGYLFVGGGTTSQNSGQYRFPTTTGAYDTTLENLGQDAFVAKVLASSGYLEACTYLGGGDADRGGFNDCLELDANGQPVLAGQSWSESFPDSSNVPTINLNHSEGASATWPDAFVAVLEDDLTALAFVSYFGHELREEPAGLAIDNYANIYLSGETRSPQFYCTANAFDNSFANVGPTGNKISDGFLLKFYYGGDAGSIAYSTFYGGSTEVASPPSDFDSRGTRLRCLVDVPNREGHVMFCCSTTISDMPTTSGALFTTQQGGERDGFAAYHITN